MILLLTGCINPNGMSFTALNNQEERLNQYVRAIRFYIENTNYSIVFTENSGTNISSLFTEHIESGRLECLTFLGNHNKERGKGYGECEIIQYALENSKQIKQSHDKRIVKITGRLIVKNINSIVRFHSFLFSKRRVFCAINSDFSFPDSRLIIAPTNFYHTFLLKKNDINDSKYYYFEHALRDTIIQTRKKYPYSPFLLMPHIEGISGSTGKIYENSQKSVSFFFKYMKFTISELYRFKKKFC